ncbi:Panacea domain-containing protein [Brucellaceae bacterium D45D]
MHDSKVIANRLLERASENNDTLTPMQLLKLVYIAHGWMLGLYGRPLIQNEVQAWQYGPVIPTLYNSIRQFRSNPVEGPLPVRKNEELDEQETDIVDQVYEIYGHLSGPELSRLTHASGTPWDLTYKPGEFGCVISNDIIEDHYQRRAAETGSTAN